MDSLVFDTSGHGGNLEVEAESILALIAAVIAIVGVPIGLWRWWAHRQERIDQVINDLHEVRLEEEKQLLLIEEYLPQLMRTYCAAGSAREERMIVELLAKSYRTLFFTQTVLETTETWIARVERHRPFIVLSFHSRSSRLAKTYTKTWTEHWREMRSAAKEFAANAEFAKLLESLSKIDE